MKIKLFNILFISAILASTAGFSASPLDNDNRVPPPVRVSDAQILDALDNGDDNLDENEDFHGHTTIEGYRVTAQDGAPYRLNGLFAGKARHQYISRDDAEPLEGGDDEDNPWAQSTHLTFTARPGSPTLRYRYPAEGAQLSPEEAGNIDLYLVPDNEAAAQ